MAHPVQIVILPSGKAWATEACGSRGQCWPKFVSNLFSTMRSASEYPFSTSPFLIEKEFETLGTPFGILALYTSADDFDE